MPLVEQELFTLPEHLNSPPVFSGVRVTRSIVLCVCFVDRCLPNFFLAIVLSVLLRKTDSDYHFVIFKLFLLNENPMSERKAQKESFTYYVRLNSIEMFRNSKQKYNPSL